MRAAARRQSNAEGCRCASGGGQGVICSLLWERESSGGNQRNRAERRGEAAKNELQGKRKGGSGYRIQLRVVTWEKQCEASTSRCGTQPAEAASPPLRRCLCSSGHRLLDLLTEDRRAQAVTGLTSSRPASESMYASGWMELSGDSSCSSVVTPARRSERRRWEGGRWEVAAGEIGLDGVVGRQQLLRGARQYGQVVACWLGRRMLFRQR